MVVTIPLVGPGVACEHGGGGDTIGAYEIVRFSRPFRGPFSAVSTPNFENKSSFCSMFQALQDYPYIIPDILRMFETVIPFLLQMSSFLAQVAKFDQFHEKEQTFQNWLN